MAIMATFFISQGAEEQTDDNAGTSPSVTLVINELMADNGAVLRAPDGTYPDWVELHNRGGHQVNMSGMYLADSLKKPTWQFPNGTVIEAGGYLLVWADGNPSQGDLHADFRLRANGEAVSLLATDGETLIDSITYGKQIEDVSYGRMPDGGPDWAYLTSPTPGAANVENVRAISLVPWPVWPLLAGGLGVCVMIILRDRSQAGGKK